MSEERPGGEVQRRVRVEIAEHVAAVTLTRPESTTRSTCRCWTRSWPRPSGSQASREVRAVVLHGAGTSFCSGLDFAGVMSAPPAAETAPGRAR